MLRVVAKQAHGVPFSDLMLLRDHGRGWKLLDISLGQKRLNHGTNGNLAHMVRGGSVPLMDTTIGQVLGTAAERWPDRELLVSVDENVRLTNTDVIRRADRLAAGLKKLGLKMGDRIGMWGPNVIDWFVVFMAVARAGCILVAINPAYQFDEVRYCIQKVQASAIIAPAKFKTQDYPRMLLQAKQDCPSFQHVIVTGEEHVTGTRRLCDVADLASKAEIEAIAKEQDAISPYSGCNIQFTSGTTGKPKATLLSHRSLTNNSRQMITRYPPFPEGLKMCLNVPFFHAFGIVKSLGMLQSGGTMVLESPSFNPVKSIDAILKEKCKTANGTPTMWINLLDAHQRVQAPPLKLAYGVTGGSPAPSELFKRIRDRFHMDNIKTIYGQTEATAVVCQSLLDEPTDLTDNTVGQIADHVEMKVVDTNDNTVQFGEVGELWIRGYSIMKKYWDDEESTAKTVTKDGWLKTGDQFVLRKDGYGHIIGRLKEMLIRGGENLFPKEVEDFLMTHPQVLEAQVIGAYDAVYGEEICACVRLRQGATLTGEELRSYCRGKIAHFKIPRYVEFVEEYPKTASGKVQKFLLKEEMERKGVIPATPSRTKNSVPS